MNTVYLCMFWVGVYLTVWANGENPRGAVTGPAPLPPGVPRITTGPYRFLKHPMYVGQWLTIVGGVGLGGGWAVISVGLLAGLMFVEWAWREGGSK